MVPQEADEIDDYRAVAPGSPGLKHPLSKWASSQPAGDKINNYSVCGPKPRVENKNDKINKAIGDETVNKINKYPKSGLLARVNKTINTINAIINNRNGVLE